MRFRNAIRVVTIAGLVCLVLCTCALGALRWQMQSGLEKYCRIAQAAHPHPGDDVAALLDYAQSTSHSLRQRDYVVWALGQARDPRALPFLESCYTGEPCDHEHGLCQGELKKAIDLCRGPAPNLLLLHTPSATERTD